MADATQAATAGTASETEAEAKVKTATATGADKTTAEGEKSVTDESPEARIARMDEALKKANKEAEKYRKAAEAFEKAEQAKKEAELSETEKLKKELAEAKTKAAAAERSALLQKIALETGLPPILAERLQGEDEDALREDAKKLLELVAKDATKTAAKAQGSATLPASGKPPETDEQKKARLLGRNQPNVFDIEAAKAAGGGVIWPE